MKTTDADVGKYLSMFTLLKKDAVAKIMENHQVSNCIFANSLKESR